MRKSYSWPAAALVLLLVLTGPAWSQVCGDVDNNAIGPDISDLTYLTNYFFTGGPPPPNPWTANVDGECGIDIKDLHLLVDHMFHAGPPLNCAPPTTCDYPVDGALAMTDAEGLVWGDIGVGNPVTFHIDMTGLAENITSGSFGFRVYGAIDLSGMTPDPTVTWDPMWWDSSSVLFNYVENPPGYWYASSAYWNEAFKIQNHSINGSGADTIGLIGVTTPGNVGVPAGLTGEVLALHVNVSDPAMQGRFLCLDSCWFPPVGEWFWDAPGQTVAPAWSGPHCYQIGEGVLCGDINGDGGGPDISDLTYLVDWMFKGGSAPPSMYAANVDGQCGVDARDLQYLYRYLNEGGPAPNCADPIDCVHPEDGAFYVDEIDGLVDGQLSVGNDVTFNIDMEGLAETIEVGSFGWRVYGATDGGGTTEDPSVVFDPIWWDSTSDLFHYDWVAVPGVWVEACDYWDEFVIGGINIDGIGGDTVGIVGLEGSGVPPGFQGRAMSIHVNVPTEDDLGKFICLDSCWNPPAGPWFWNGPSGSVAPAWNGPHCVEIAPQVICGDINGDLVGPNIVDLVDLVEWMFNDGPEPDQLWAANVDGCDGVNILDIRYLINFMFHNGPDLQCGETGGCVINPGGAFSLDGVDGLSGGDIMVGEPITFNIRMTNLGSDLMGGTNGFRVYGASDANGTPDQSVTWEPVTYGSALDLQHIPEGLGYGPAPEWGEGNEFWSWDYLYKEYEAGVTGEGADTVGFGGFALEGPGLPADFDEVVYTIGTEVTDHDQVCKYLCLDSAWYPPTGDWLWANVSGAYQPTWDGPHCFKITQHLDVDFLAYPAKGQAPLTVMFDPTLPTDANSYRWFFGDGDTSDVMYPIHTYETNGNYDVKLRISYDSKQCGETVDSVIKEDYIVVTDLEAAFEAAPVAGSVPLTVSFTDLSSGGATSWEWDFGDGGTSLLANPVHEYEEPGTYDVSLVVAADGVADTLLKSAYIHVSETLYAELESDIRLNPFTAQPSAEVRYWIFWANRGTQEAGNCSLRVVLPDELEGWDLVDEDGFPVSYAMSDDTAVVELGVVPSDHQWRYVIAEGMLSSSLAPGDTLRSESWVSSNPPDSTSGDNYCLHEQEILDPGGKAGYSEWKIASPNGTPYPWQVEAEDVITYWIQYINPGPFDAEYIRVSDTLDPNLDRGTFELMDMPSACTYDFDARSGVVSFTCDDIFLAASDTAFFGYTVQVKHNRLYGTEIPNSGWIGIDNNGFEQIGPVIRIVGTCCLISGDVNLDGAGPQIDDLVYLNLWMFKQGEEPPCFDSADIDGLGVPGAPDIADLVYMVNYMFKGGPAPVGCPGE